VNIVASIDEAARQIGYERLRSAALGLADRADERSDERELHRAITL
jgi:hypothetical protein